MENDLLNKILKNVKNSWKKIINDYNNKHNNDLNNILENNEKLIMSYKESQLNINIFPKHENIFKCFSYFEINETSIVIIGQDPYHSPHQATGLCFGVNNNISYPPSLKNIYKELKNDLNIELKDCTLKSWAKQNILLLNASLTVIQGKPSSQMSLWNNFTNYIINELNKCDHSIIFVAWGAFAHNKLKNIDLNKHSMVVSSHPSPLSVFKPYKNYPSFNESKPFSKINEILKKNNQKIINW